MWPNRRILLAAALAGAAVSCQSAESKECRTLMEVAQGVVKGVDSSSLDSVSSSHAAVQKAIIACEKAGRTQEADQLRKAENELGAHLKYLEGKKNRRAEAKLTPEQLETLVKKGDPNCPKGQAYKHRESGEEIRCSGPQVGDLGWAAAKEYYESKGYKMQVTKTKITAEYGAELYVYEYASPEDAGPPKCLEATIPPGMSWQEAVSRLTGKHPQFVKKDQPIKMRKGMVPLKVTDTAKKAVVTLGTCG